MLKTYQVIASGRDHTLVIRCYRFHDGKQVAVTNHGRNSMDAHFQALADGYTNEGSATKGYNDAVAYMNGDRN